MRVVFLLLAATLLAQRPDQGPGLRPNPARDAALAEIVPVTTGLREDDHPAVASRNGAVWVAWVSYSETEGSSHVFVRSWANGKWSPPERVTDTGGDYHKPAICIDDQDTVWVAWPAQVNGNWDLFGRRRSRAEAWSRLERWTNDPAPDFFPSLAAGDRGNVMLVWQSMRRGNMDVFHKVSSAGNWSLESPVSDSPANDWEPAVVATRDGFVVAWDSFRGDYDVILRAWRNGSWAAEMPVAQSPKLENHAALSVDGQGRVWIGYEVGPEAWAADSANDGLRPKREIGVACLRDGKLFSVPLPTAGKDGLESAMPFVAGGGLRLFLRKPMNKNWEWVGSTTWDGAAWSAPEWLLHSEGRIDQRVVAADAGQGRVMAVYPAGSSHNVIYARVYALAQRDSVPPLTELDTRASKPAPASAQPHIFRGHRLVWGDLHRHTDISEDGGLRDGSLLDAMRYAVDAAGLDFLGITDHTRYLPRRYNLWRIQQISDMLYKPGFFTPMHAYERSQYTPWGHRNVVHLERNYTPVPASYDLGDPGVSPWGLFDALRGKKAMSIPHTSAWGNKQVSWDYFDPQVERLVEMYQGLRSTYEYNGAPDPAGRVVYEKDSKGFVWDALSRGRKLGFIASSDHGSTHMSFAAVYVKSNDRAGVFEGLTARRTYAATDKILLDVSIGNAMMGEETTVTGTPEVRVEAEGTADIERVDVIKNGAFAYTVEPRTRRVSFTFRDSQFDGKECHYYVRVIQANKQMAWGSPVWVRR